MGEAFPAIVADLKAVGRTGNAGKRDDRDQGLFQAFLQSRAFSHAVGERLVFPGRAQGQAESQPDPLADDRALFKNTVAVLRDLAGNDPVGAFVKILEIAAVQIAFVGKAGDFRKDLASDLGNWREYPSHRFPSCLVRQACSRIRAMTVSLSAR